jgi:hypothetical protein
VRQVVSALDNPPASRHELLGRAQRALPAPGADHPVSDEVRQLVAELGWHVADSAPALRSLSAAIEAARSAGLGMAPESLRGYARATEGIAAVDLAGVSRAASLSEALATVVVGTVLVEPILAALRRLAQEHVSSSAG